MIVRLVTLLLLTLALWAQNPNTAKYPSALPTDTDLLVAKNRLDAALTLSSNIDASTLTVAVNDGSLVPITGVIRIDYELLKICSRVGNTLTVCASGRGFDGSVAQSHSAGASISNVISAWYHNQLAAEIIAITTRLGTGFNGQALSTTQITTGQLALARGGTGADLSATGGSGYVLKQSSVGAGVTVAALAASELSNGTTGSGSVVLATSPTIVTPTIASFTNATHSHTNAAGGGTLVGASALSDYSTAFVTSITGTANQVIASASVGGVTLSLPQSIHTGATPTFAGITNAGTLALSATGANVITLATNGTTRLTVASNGAATFSGNVAAPYLGLTNASAANDTTHDAVLINYGADGTLGPLYLAIRARPSATGGNRYVALQAGDNSAYRPIALNPSGGNLLVGTTTDGNYKLDVASSGSSGTLRVYDQTATTGVTSLVVEAGAGQSTNALITINSLASGYALTQYQDNGTVKYTSGKDDLNRWYLYDHTNSRNVFLYTPSTGVYQLNAAGGEVLIAASGGKIGFFGATPVVKQTVTADAASILAALQAYGLAV